MNIATAEQMLLDNQKFVYSVCNTVVAHNDQESRMNLVGLSREDLIQEGMIGLWKACLGFDESKGNKFSSYAYQQIKGYILNLLNKSSEFKFETKMKWDEKLEADNVKVRLNTMIPDENGKETEIINLLDSSKSMSFNEDALGNDELIDLNSAVANLNEKERYVIENYYFKGKTVKEIAKEQGVTFQAISLNNKKALKKLKATKELAYT